MGNGLGLLSRDGLTPTPVAGEETDVAVTLHGHIAESQFWGTRKPLTLVSVPPTLFPSKAEFGLLKFCTLIKL